MSGSIITKACLRMVLALLQTVLRMIVRVDFNQPIALTLRRVLVDLRCQVTDGKTQLLPDNLNRSDIRYLSVERVELSSLSSLSDWINVSICVDRGAKNAFIFLVYSNGIHFKVQEL